MNSKLAIHLTQSYIVMITLMEVDGLTVKLKVRWSPVKIDFIMNEQFIVLVSPGKLSIIISLEVVLNLSSVLSQTRLEK